MKTTVIAPYTLAHFGIDLPAACIEVTEVNSRIGQGYYSSVPTGEEDQPAYKNTLVRFRVFADQAAYDAKKSPLAEGEKTVDLPTATVTTVMKSALALAFPAPETTTTTK